MTTGWIIINIALGVALTVIVGSASVLIPMRLDRETAPSAAHNTARVPAAGRRSREEHQQARAA